MAKVYRIAWRGNINCTVHQAFTTDTENLHAVCPFILPSEKTSIQVYLISMGIKKVYKTLYFVRKANVHMYSIWGEWHISSVTSLEALLEYIYIGRIRSFECLYKIFEKLNTFYTNKYIM